MGTQKLFPNGTTLEDEIAIAEGIKHFQGQAHDKTVCPSCQVVKIHLQWVRDHAKEVQPYAYLGKKKK